MDMENNHSNLINESDAGRTNWLEGKKKRNRKKKEKKDSVLEKRKEKRRRKFCRWG